MSKMSKTGTFNAGESMIRGMEQAIAWANGEQIAARSHKVRLPEVNVKEVRSNLNLTQSEFASRYGFPPSSIRNWEQGRRKPAGPARILLTIIDREPEAVERALKAGASGKP